MANGAVQTDLLEAKPQTLRNSNRQVVPALENKAERGVTTG